MDIQHIIFWTLCMLTLGCAVGVIMSRNPINSVLFLILTFFTVSAHYVMMNAQFLAIVNIIVYAGAIMVLFLFVIMLMNLNGDTEPQKNTLVQFAAVISGGALLLILIAAFKSTISGIDGKLIEYGQSTDIGLIKNLGKVLFTDYVFPFEIASVLFLSAMVGAVVLGKKDKEISTVEEM
ncbi:MAG: NADH-quinone oxidoreductase subunit J [Bacteroidetes bacterium]|jgi:NADH-quinone oxidoreductase subunit J|nr:NADH-quinone oxidoreductase subunit J [Bacteroidota bacterium]MBK6820986.1 NADH-quinone oxidoreductase subunit J [Bacteroidota bacterium]MBK9300881.1 NADH-quinone oxidoreductase subunit J [Bacteroidota bacterium]